MGTESALVAFIIVALIAVLAASFFMWLGARIAGVYGSTYGRAMVAAVGSAFITWLASFVLLELGLSGTLTGFLIGLLITLLVIKAAFDTTFGKALLVWIFNILAQALALWLGTLLFADVITVAAPSLVPL